jgi:PadR family transcriptional regulator PadR
LEEDLKNNEESTAPSEEENKSAISSDLIRGHINTIILRTLYERDKYGYEIIEEIESKSHGQYTLKQPTLYSALKRLESQGYINAYWKTDEVSNGGRRKYYTLTESGREITEKNQNEWEYSRTVIDSLISDRNFDFTQPPPTPVDFKILKSSTSRVPTVKIENEESKTEEVVSEQLQKQPETIAEQPSMQPQSEPVPLRETEQVAPVRETVALPTPPVSGVAEVEQPTQPQQIQHVEQPAAVYHDRLTEERRIHENYLKLISEPIAPPEETPTNPYSERIDTDKLIYNKKPETERDYKNLIDNLYVRTVKQQKTEPQITRETAATVVQYDDANAKANADGLSVSSSDYIITNAKKKKYNRGSTLFKCSLIIAVVMLVEFALSLAFRENLGVAISYPIVILVTAIAQLLIFGVLTTTDFGKTTRKPVNNSYLTTTIVLAIISILIIFVTAVLLNVNFALVGDVMAKIVIPGLVALNIPAFAVLFYVFSK